MEPDQRQRPPEADGPTVPQRARASKGVSRARAGHTRNGAAWQRRKAGSEERRNAARLLRALTRQTFVGLAAGREDGRPHLFIFRGDGFQADFKTVAARDETFAQRVQCVFRVEQVEWEVERQEAVGDEPFKPVFKPADHVVHAQA